MLLIQFYIIHDDELGREFAERLIERAQAGVRIYLLYDDVGSFCCLPLAPTRSGCATPASACTASTTGTASCGCSVRHASSTATTLHKVVIVDGKEAWVGGLNVGDEYMGRSKKFRALARHACSYPSKGQRTLAAARAELPRGLASGPSGERSWTNLPGSTEIAGDQSMLIMPTGPADELESCAIAFDDVIGQSQKRLWIVSPYFVPDLSMETALLAAQMRGVDVRILIPEKPDHRIVWLASIAYALRMVHHGIDVYRYPSGFLHQKVILVDDKIAGVGTVNFDNRSFRINFEITMWFTGDKG